MPKRKLTLKQKMVKGENPHSTSRYAEKHNAQKRGSYKPTSPFSGAERAPIDNFERGFNFFKSINLMEEE